MANSMSDPLKLVKLERDSISNLPDSLLHHILTFLQTREAVATSLLSKRWRPLWLSMPTFDFDCRNFHSLDSFTQFVDAVLSMTDSKTTIEKFRLRCESCYQWVREGVKYYNMLPNTKINIWINTALNRRVDHLELRFSSWDKFIDLPPRTFNCSTIRVLKLHGVKVDNPYSINLPLLKVMHMLEVEISNFEFLTNLLSSCALLEELVLDFFINDEDDVDVDDDVPLLNVDKLEHLVSANIPSHLFTWKAFTNVTFLSLMTYTASGNDYFPRFDHLTHLEFECLYDEDLNWIVEVLPNCPKLEILDIDEIEVNPKRLGRIMEPIVKVPQCISSQLKEFILGAYDGSECEFEFVRFIMKNARVLRTISIFSCSSEDKKYDQMLKRLSSCPRGSENCRLLFDEVSLDASV
ncbi:F-box/FBD/LRR-repeat protein At5g56420-like [Prosopis cineraria]|uniref:F-box/FBD/LRR-repeat protein At5g56420-like n=1 Tax=Prosopis cineraria TaxID=364024 RepID=UPI00240FF1A1|nr:F-box/FBD/LRR-repeat protein At5g56420-like [Prosopis cineraria]